jgi:hypothetical protein
VETLAVFDNVLAIVEKLKACAPDIVFNLTESGLQTVSFSTMAVTLSKAASVST